MDRAEMLQFKILVYSQLAVIVTYTVINTIELINRLIIKGQIYFPAYLFIFFNILLFISFYILVKKNRTAGSYLFFAVLSFVLIANILLNDHEYVNIQTIYILPILLTLITSDRFFKILYSIIILMIFVMDQIIHNQVLSLNFITIFFTMILCIIIFNLYENWIRTINNLRIESMNNNYNSTLRILGRVAELKDEETHEHLERVSIIVEMMAERLKKNPYYSHYLTDFYIEDLKASSALHDIGKIAIDDKLLSKNGKLTSDEHEEVKKHTTFGADLLEEAQLKTSNKLYDLAIELARHHHEKWDGTGYPDKLQGRDIPLSARIMSIADVYDALVSKRPYKKAYSEREAFAIIVSESGVQFDPDLVRIFMKIHKKIYAAIEHLL